MFEVVKGEKHKEEGDSDDDDNKNLSLMIKKFTKFMNAKGKNQFKRNKKESRVILKLQVLWMWRNWTCKGRLLNSKKSEKRKGINFFKKKAYIA